ncbi:MAG: WG repeat-containing protein [Clostridia bacterium]|nr:WG repeat-containing protein [Clostridia bacterium]MBQ6706582.1 WG repeat-containing protein [Clostridia bacterium]
MKIIFSKPGKWIHLVDEERLVFCIDNVFYDISGIEIPVDKSSYNNTYEEDEWDQYWMDDEGLDEPLRAVSTVEPQYEIDDAFGSYGFKNKAGDFVIAPQYAYAHEFTKGLAAVNLNRTWYTTKDGKRYYENHYGYIDGKGKTIIGFQYDEAYPFNKYGVALVSDSKNSQHLIDIQGNEIPGTRFAYIAKFEFPDRFVEFSYEKDYGGDIPMGIYDTKERKILLEPSVASIIERTEDCIQIYETVRRYGVDDFHQYYINSKGEILYPWLNKKEFSVVAIPDANLVSAVARSEFTELTGNPRSCFEHNGKKYDRKFFFGLYSSKEKFLLPQKYDDIKKIADDMWSCHKDGIITVVQTEPND